MAEQPAPLVTWKHRDGRIILVFADRKIRLHYSTKDRGFGSPSSDEWPILYRSDVPSLTNEQWTEPPTEEGWVQE